MPNTHQEMLAALESERRTVSYDGYDIIIRQLVDMIRSGEIDIAPDYQRHFIWTDDRESELIESILLGIPVPSLYVAVNAHNGVWEVIDGVQRLSTILHFVGEPTFLTRIDRLAPLELANLSKLSSFNEATFANLPGAVRTGFLNRGLRVTALNDRSDFNVRFDLFERLNTGGVGLHPQEIRTILFRGAFVGIIRDLAEYPPFRSVVKFDREKTKADYEEAVLRFFAFVERYQNFDHLVRQFLNTYMHDKAVRGPDQSLVQLFEETFNFLNAELPNGIIRGRATTPIALFEGVAVGTALAIQQNAAARPGILAGLMADAQLRSFTGAGTNTRRMVKGRIECVRDALG